MKFQRIGTGAAPRMVAFSVTLATLFFVAATAFAVDEDLPPPDAGELQVPRATSPTSTAVQIEDETLPSPSLGDDALPEPSADRGQENPRNQVNRPPEDDDIFLPTPNVNDNINYAPVGTPAPRMAAEDVDWRVVSNNRPMFSLFLGLANKAYVNVEVKGRQTGPTVGASIRFLNIGQTVFAHAYADVSWFKPGDVLSVPDVKDQQIHVGGLLEFALGRRISIYGSLLVRSSQVTTDKLGSAKPAGYNTDDLADVGEPSTLYLGAGLQWDFYVIPHGSLGARFHVERDLFALTLQMAMEPRPRRKLTLNFEDSDRY
jgi:hypothetical protein